MATAKIDMERFREETSKGLIDKIAADLDAADSETTNQLPESVFVANFLPFFAGDKVPPHINEGLWAGIAGNPYKSVHIVKDGTSEILFTVPPMFGREGVDPTKADKGAHPLFHVMQTAQQLLNMSPAASAKYLENQFNKRNLSQDARDVTAKAVQAWSDIFARYNRKLPGAEPEATPGKPAEKQRQELDYDDGIF